MRPLPALAAALLLLPAAAAAQSASGVDISTAPRQRVVTVFGEEKCPGPSRDPDEIIVCKRVPADQQYRIPQAVRNTPIIARRDDVSARKRLADDSVNPVSCSTVGTVGQFGCSRSGISVLGAVKAAKDAVTGNLQPEVPKQPQ